MSNMNTNHLHILTFETPTWRDYRNGGFGDLVAQCSCGAHEYVISRREGAYWHALHLARPTEDYRFLTIAAPMPEGWEPTAEQATVVPLRRSGYTCPECHGAGNVEAFGPRNGRFYHFGERAACSCCAGVGRVAEWSDAVSGL